MIIYLDNMLLMADSAQEARSHLRAAVKIVIELGYVIDMKKSVFQPSQTLEFLGFMINTQDKLLSLPHQRLYEV